MPFSASFDVVFRLTGGFSTLASAFVAIFFDALSLAPAPSSPEPFITTYATFSRSSADTSSRAATSAALSLKARYSFSTYLMGARGLAPAQSHRKASSEKKGARRGSCTERRREAVAGPTPRREQRARRAPAVAAAGAGGGAPDVEGEVRAGGGEEEEEDEEEEEGGGREER